MAIRLILPDMPAPWQKIVLTNTVLCNDRYVGLSDIVLTQGGYATTSGHCLVPQTSC